MHYTPGNKNTWRPVDTPTGPGAGAPIIGLPSNTHTHTWNSRMPRPHCRRWSPEETTTLPTTHTHTCGGHTNRGDRGGHTNPRIKELVMEKVQAETTSPQDNTVRISL